MDSIYSKLAVSNDRVGIYLYEDYAKEPVFYSYKYILDRCCQFASYFQGLGIRKQSRVLVAFESDLDIICSFLALPLIGAIPLSIKPPFAGGNLNDYDHFINLMKAKYAVDFILVKNRSEFPVSIQDWIIDLADVEFNQCRFEINLFNDLHDRLCENDIAFVQFSSGSTGTPKGIPITFKQLKKQLSYIYHSSQHQQRSVGFSWLPLYHDMGLIGLLTWMYYGIDYHLASPMAFMRSPKSWLYAMKKRSATHLSITPFGLKYLFKRVSIERLVEDNFVLDSLQHIFVGAETFDSKFMRVCAENLSQIGINPKSIISCYGMAEAVLMVSTNPKNLFSPHRLNQFREYVSVGKPVDDYRVSIRNDNGQELSDGEEGCIYLKGGTLVESYFDGLGAIVDEDGYYDTGDLGFLSKGELYITGRIGDRIKINGQSWSATDLENKIEALNISKLGLVAAIQPKDEVHILLQPISMSIVNTGSNQKDKIVDSLLNQTGLKIPKNHIHFLQKNQLIITSSGKLCRKEMNRKFESGELLEHLV